MGDGAARANSFINRSLPSLVSNITTGPFVPLASKFKTSPTSLAQGCSVTKALAPSRPSSSASVKRKITSLFSGGPDF
jgi:hypothetical protein